MANRVTQIVLEIIGRGESGQKMLKETEQVAGALEKKLGGLQSVLTKVASTATGFDLSKLGGQATGGLGQAAGLLGGLGAEGGALTAATAATAGLVGGLGALVVIGKSSADSVIALAGETKKFARETGTSVETASALLAVFKRFGVDAAGASKDLGIFAKQMGGYALAADEGGTGGKKFADSMNQLGVTFKTAAGDLLPMDQVLLNVADRFKALPDGAEKTALALSLFGRGGKDMIPILNQGSAGIKELMQTAKELGLTLTGENMAAVKQYGLAHKDLNEAFEGMKLTVGTLVMPVLAEFAKLGRDFAVDLNQKVIPALKDSNSALGQIGGTISGLVDWFTHANVAVDQFGNHLGSSILKALHDIPNTRSASDPVEQWFQAQFKRYEQSAAEMAQLAAGETKKVANAAADGLNDDGAKETASTAGRAMLHALIGGLTAAQLDAAGSISKVFADLFKDAQGKADPDKAAQAHAVVAEALRDIARDGHLANDTMQDLSATFGMQTPEVAKLIAAYGALEQAQVGIAAANTKLAGAQQALGVVTTLAAGETKQLETALKSAQDAAQDHAAATVAALEPLQAALRGIQQAAQESSRAGADVIRGLQSDLSGLQEQASANAAGFAAQIADAQAKYTAAQTRRTELQGAMNAALKGETEEWLRINAITDESTRKIAEKWQAEIDGQRRAKEGANDKVTGLNRAANKENLDYLQKIQAARSGGNEKEARQLERELAARQKQRQSGLALAQAEAAVANDNYDEKAAQLAKEGKAQDEIEGTKEKAAGAEVKRIQDAAAEQKKADDAAIKAKQDQIRDTQEAQRVEQERYAAQQRGIQAEIDKTNEAARVQAAKDKKTIDDASTILADRKTFWAQEIAQATEVVTQANNNATAAKSAATDSKTLYDNLVKITQLDFANVLAMAQATKDAANQPPPPPPVALNGGGAHGGGRDERAGAGQASGAPNPGNKPGQNGGGALPQLLSGDDYLTAPAGYHAEYDDTNTLWYVANGYNLADYGKHQGQSSRGNGGDSTSLSAASVGGPTFLRTAGIGGAGLGAQTAAPADRGGIVVHINAPNLRDVGSKADQRDLAALMRRELNSAIRGGLDPGKANG